MENNCHLVAIQVNTYYPFDVKVDRQVVSMPDGASTEFQMGAAEKFLDSVRKSNYITTNWHAFKTFEPSESRPRISYEIRNIEYGHGPYAGLLYGELWVNGAMVIAATLDYIHDRIPELVTKPGQ